MGGWKLAGRIDWLMLRAHLQNVSHPDRLSSTVAPTFAGRPICRRSDTASGPNQASETDGEPVAIASPDHVAARTEMQSF